MLWWLATKITLLPVVEDLIQPQKKPGFLKWKEKVELGNLKCRPFFYEHNIILKNFKLLDYEPL